MLIKRERSACVGGESINKSANYDSIYRLNHFAGSEFSPQTSSNKERFPTPEFQQIIRAIFHPSESFALVNCFVNMLRFAHFDLIENTFSHMYRVLYPPLISSKSMTTFFFRSHRIFLLRIGCIYGSLLQYCSKK